ncbi:MAG: M48 family metallopeptidase [Proteobacteria bacterium]|nr:M48 family metallopeptidase [Pseudomonadota bacterium]MBU1709679.1 M48 family metallopeptidase [Pseudomonadota bacterium]
MNKQCQGHYLDGKTAALEAVFVICTEQGIEFTDSAGHAHFWPSAHTTQTQGAYAGEKIRLEYGDDPVQALVISDRRFLLDLKKTGIGSVKPGVSRSNTRLGLGIAVTVILLISGYVWGLPAGIETFSNLIPLSWEEKLGASVKAQFGIQFTECDSKETILALEQIIKQLNAAAPDHPYTFKVSLVKSDMVNAFAAPGGQIIIFTGLLKAAENAEEVAGVLAHEMQHILQKHATKNMLKGLSSTLMLQMIFGNQDSFAKIAMHGAQILDHFQYSRKNEEEADQLGFELMLAAGINPQGMIDFFENISHIDDLSEKIPPYLSTHPATAERIQNIISALANQEKKSAYIFSSGLQFPRTKLCGDQT